MLTVIDLTTGTVLYRSREAESGAMADERLSETQTALQPISHHDPDQHRANMPPDLADASVDGLLARWQR